MALVVKDRIKVTAAAPGTGNVTLGSAELGYQTFAAIGNNNSTYYAIQDLANNLWEVGEGTFTTSGPTLARNQILSNSAGNTSAINFTAAVEVFVTTPATKSVHMNLTDDLEIDGDVTFTSDNATDQVLIKNTNTGASAAPDLVLWRDSASPANADSVGRIDFRGEDDGSTARNYTSIESKIVNVAASTPTGAIHFKTLNASTSEADVLVLSGNAATFAGGVDAATFFRAPNFYTGVGSQGLVNTNTNDLKLVSQSGDTHIYMDNDLAVELYHNNDKKLETTSSGVTVTGAVTATTTINAGSNGGFYLIQDSSESLIRSETQPIILQTYASSAWNDRLTVTNGGNVGIGVSPAYKFHQHESSSAENYHLFTNSTTGSSSSDGFRIGIDSNEDALIWHREAENIIFATSNDQKMVIDSSGNVTFGSSTGSNVFINGADGNQKFRTFTASNGIVLGLGNNTSAGDVIRLDARTTTPNVSFINS